MEFPSSTLGKSLSTFLGLAVPERNSPVQIVSLPSFSSFRNRVYELFNSYRFSLGV